MGRRRSQPSRSEPRCGDRIIVQGGVESRLRPHVRWAIEHGATREELEALCALLAVYIGYPKASVGVQVVREELAQLDAPTERAEALDRQPS